MSTDRAPWPSVDEEEAELERAQARAQIPYMLANTPEEFQRVRDLAWPSPAPVAAEGTDELREAIAAEQARHQGLRGPMDDKRPDVWQNRCECGWDDGDEHPGWRDRYRLHIADALLAGPLAPLLATVKAEGGVALIAAERRRQVEAEGWTPEHDAEHAGEGLALAACCYALPPQMRKYRSVSVHIAGGVGVETVPTLWPWVPGYWKPTADDRVRELVKAGALIAAEIDRLRALAGESRG